MNKSITIDGKEFTLDVDKATKQGLLVELPRYVKFSDINIGEVFRFTPENQAGADKDAVCLYIKTGEGSGTRIASNKHRAGIWNTPADFSNVCNGCLFGISGDKSKYAVFRNYGWIETL